EKGHGHRQDRSRRSHEGTLHPEATLRDLRDAPHIPATSVAGKRRRAFLTWIALLASLSMAPRAPAAEPVASTEERVNDVQRDVQRSLASGDWDGAERSIRSMAAIDPQHPKVSLPALRLQQGRGALAGSAAGFDRLGLSSGPGRLYADGVRAVLEKRLDAARDPLERALQTYAATGHAAGMAACETALGNLA